uniref:Ig-like domain-containing protein n=1 Tax=Maylandia zebra TaxID=106582 RepID=A0A3P9CZU1_9CICH
MCAELEEETQSITLITVNQSLSGLQVIVIAISRSPLCMLFSGVHSAATLKVSPDSVQNPMYASVSLTCEGNFTEWRVKWFPNDGPLFYSNCGRMTGSTCNISYILKSPTAVYWCESDSGDFSNAVNITVQSMLLYILHVLLVIFSPFMLITTSQFFPTTLLYESKSVKNGQNVGHLGNFQSYFSLTLISE